MSVDDYRCSHADKGHGQRYDSLLFNSGRYDYGIWRIEKNILKKLIEKYFKSKVNDYLDFACGTGRIINFLESFCENSMGIDISADMLAVAKSRCKNQTFMCADITEQKVALLNNHKFDLITCFRFLLNAQQDLRKQALDALYELLDDDGYLVFNVHGVCNSFLWIILIVRRLLGMSVGNSLSTAEIFDMLKESGFKIIEIRSVCFLPRIMNRLLPQKIWIGVERLLGKMHLFNKLGIYRIFVAKKNQP